MWNALRHYDRWCTRLNNTMLTIKKNVEEEKAVFISGFHFVFHAIIHVKRMRSGSFFYCRSSIFMVFYCCCLVFCCCCWCNCICLVIIAIKQGWDGALKMCMCIFFSACSICFSSRHRAVDFVCYIHWNHSPNSLLMENSLYNVDSILFVVVFYLNLKDSSHHGFVKSWPSIWNASMWIYCA